MNKLSKIFIIILILILIGLCVGIWKSAHIINAYKADVYQANQRVDMLSMTVIEQDKTITDLQHTITGLNQQAENLNIKYTADELVIATLEDRYSEALRYIDMAEWILGKQDITFLYTGIRE